MTGDREQGLAFRWGRLAAVLTCGIALLALPSWGPALRDPATGLRLTAYQASALTTDRAPATIGPVVDVVDDVTARQLYGRFAFHHHAIGSITKLMTALLAVHHLKLSRVLTVSQKAATVGGSSMWLHTGDRLTVRALLYGLLIPSGNDAAETLAEGLAGNDRGFARMANRQAKSYRLVCSHYVTPHGLDAAGQYSCAHDVASMMRRVLENRLLVKIMGTAQAVVHGVGKHEVFPLFTTDDLLGTYPGVIAGKTGTTQEAGASLTVADRQLGHVLICVVLSSSYSGRFSDCAALLSFSFHDFYWPQPVATMWSTASLERPTRVIFAPVPKWEAAWISVGRRGLISVPYDSHR